MIKSHASGYKVITAREQSSFAFVDRQGERESEKACKQERGIKRTTGHKHHANHVPSPGLRTDFPIQPLQFPNQGAMTLK